MGTSSRFSTKREDIVVVVMDGGIIAQMIYDEERFQQSLIRL